MWEMLFHTLWIVFLHHFFISSWGIRFTFLSPTCLLLSPISPSRIASTIHSTIFRPRSNFSNLEMNSTSQLTNSHLHSLTYIWEIHSTYQLTTFHPHSLGS